MNDDKTVRRWNDKAQLIIAGIVIITALFGWAHSEWANGNRIDAQEKRGDRIEPLVYSDHDQLHDMQAKLDYIVKGIDDLKRR